MLYYDPREPQFLMNKKNDIFADHAKMFVSSNGCPHVIIFTNLDVKSYSSWCFKIPLTMDNLLKMENLDKFIEINLTIRSWIKEFLESSI